MEKNNNKNENGEIEREENRQTDMQDSAADIQNTQGVRTAADRSAVIIRTSLVGILANVMLSVFKASVGVFTRSIAVTLDALNNLSDAFSSTVVIVGTRLAGKAPDRKHPLGHGRIEYLSSLAVSGIILYAGLAAIVESVKKIIHPEVPTYSALSLFILCVAVAVKLFLGRYVTAQGKKVNSGALIAAGSDASFDAILSSSVLACAILNLLTGLSLEPWVGLMISVFIVRAGVGMVLDTLDDILGRRADPEITRRIREIIMEEPEIIGVYDLMLNDYGPEKFYASVHLELPDIMTVEQVDVLTRTIEEKVYRETGVILTGVGVYSFNTGGGKAQQIRNRVQKLVLAHDWVLQLHGFHVDIEKKEMRFDVVLSFDIRREEALSVLKSEMEEEYPDYSLRIVPDIDLLD